MSNDEIRNAIEVMQASINGSIIQHRERLSSKRDKWRDVELSPSWDWPRFEYRIKPEPFSGWFVVSDNMVTRVCDSLADAMAEKAMIGGRVVKLVEVEE